MGPKYQVRFSYIGNATTWQEYAPVYRASCLNGVLSFYTDKNHTKQRVFNIGVLRDIEIVRLSD